MNSKIKHIQQKQQTDCGIACVAMLFELSYSKILSISQKLFDDWGTKSNNYRTDYEMIKQLIKEIKPTGNFRFRTFKNWVQIQGRNLISVRYHERKDAEATWHWIVAERKDGKLMIYDPMKPKASYTIDGRSYNNIHRFLRIAK